MAKHCENCNLPYPDELDSCPHCAPPAEGVEEAEAILFEEEPGPSDSSQAILVDEGSAAEEHPFAFDEHRHAPAAAEEGLVELVDEAHPADEHAPAGHAGPAPGAAAEPPPFEEGLVELADVHVLGEESGVTPAAQAGEPVEVAPPSEDSAVDLVHPAEPLAGDSGPPLAAAQPAEPASGTSDVSWAALVEEEAAVPAGSDVKIDSPSDVDLGRRAFGEEMSDVRLADPHSGQGLSDVRLAPEPGPEEVTPASDVRLTHEPPAEEAPPAPPQEVPLASAVEETPAAPAAEEHLFEALEEVPSAAAGEEAPVEAVEDFAFGEESPVEAGGSVEGSPVGHGEKAAGGEPSGSDLAEVAADPGSESPSAIDLAAAAEEPASGSAVDLTGAEAAPEESSAIDLTAAEAAPSSTSGLDFAELVESDSAVKTPAAEDDLAEALEEVPEEGEGLAETLAFDSFRPGGEEAAHGEEGPGADEDLEEITAAEGPPSARDIVEEVESGVGLEGESAPASGLEETVSLEPGAVSGDDSAVDLGAPPSRAVGAEAPSGPEKAAAGAIDSDMLMAAMQDEAGAEAPAEGAEHLAEEPVSEPAEGEEEPAAIEEEEGEGAAAAAAPRPAKARAGAVPWVGGWLLGTVLTAGAAAALWFVGMIPERNPVKPAGRAGGPSAQQSAQAPSLESAHTRLAGGDYQEALKMYGQLGEGAGNAENPSLLAERGEALWLSALQKVASQTKRMPRKEDLANVPEVGQAQQDLTKAANANNADAWYWLGQIQEVMVGPDAARKTYENGAQQFPAHKRRFQAALDNLDIAAPAQGAPGARLNPAGDPHAEAYWLAVAILALQQPAPGGDQPPPPMGGGAAPQPPAGADEGAADEEAGYYFWNAVKLAQNNDYAEAVKALKKAQEVHEGRRFARLRKAQNPLSDPTEQIFLRATDELLVFWQVREKLEDAGLLAKGKRTDPQQILKSVARLTDEQKTLTGLEGRLKEEKYDTSDLAKAVEQLFDDKAKADKGKKDAEEKIANTLAALKAAGVKDADDPVKGVEALGEGKKDVDKKIVDALKAAGVKDADDPVKGIQALDEGKKGAEKKVADIKEALKAADVKDADDAVKGVEEVVQGREKAYETLDEARKKLVDRKYLPSSSARPDVPKGVDRVLQDVDHPLAAAFGHLANDLGGLGGKVGREVAQDLNTEARLTAAQMQAARLDAMLADIWTPEQMMDIWLALLRSPEGKGLSGRALKDVGRVLAEKKMPAAVCVKGLAERDRGEYDAARADLKSIENAPGEPDAAWRRVVRETLAELTDPSAHYVPRAQALGDEGRWDAALATLDQAVKVFPKESFPRENASLLALRSLVRLQTARSGKGADAVFQDSRQDANDAAAGGETVEGAYAQGYLAEAEGDLPGAERLYRDAVKAFEAAGQGGDFRRDHPASDPTGNRYREALSRVLLAQVGRARPVPTPEPPAEQPKEGSKTGRRDAAGETTADAAVTTVVTPAKLTGWVGGSPEVCVPPLVLLQAAEGEGAEGADPRLQEALDQADRLIAAGDARGYLIRGEALCRLGRWNEGRQALIEGARRALPPGDGERIAFLLQNHPAFQRREGVKPPDPVLGEEYYAAGLREYFDGRFVPAERNFSDAVYYNDQDARYLNFLGLAQLAQGGKRQQAVENFRMAGRLEAQAKPSSAAVSVSLERVQGPPREFLNQVRERAIRDFTSRQP
jgi:tetratricopeptide (TPR) repeat protein